MATRNMSSTASAGSPAATTAESIVIRFAGDSGDGIQLTGTQFTTTAALLGNDIASLPDFPAEIRAPRGTLAGVSGYQLQFSSGDIFTPGDGLDCLVAFNPAALKANIGDLEANGVLIVNADEFGERDLQKAGYDHQEKLLQKEQSLAAIKEQLEKQVSLTDLYRFPTIRTFVASLESGGVSEQVKESADRGARRREAMAARRRRRGRA